MSAGCTSQCSVAAEPDPSSTRGECAPVHHSRGRCQAALHHCPRKPHMESAWAHPAQPLPIGRSVCAPWLRSSAGGTAIAVAAGGVGGGIAPSLQLRSAPIACRVAYR